MSAKFSNPHTLTTARNQPHTPSSQTMGNVAITTALFALGTYLGLHLTGGVGMVGFVAALGCLVGMRFAARRSAELTVGLLGAFGPLIGLAVAPTIADYVNADPHAPWEAGGATALFIAGSGAAAYATRRRGTASADYLLGLVGPDRVGLHPAFTEYAPILDCRSSHLRRVHRARLPTAPPVPRPGLGTLTGRFNFRRRAERIRLLHDRLLEVQRGVSDVNEILRGYRRPSSAR